MGEATTSIVRDGTIVTGTKTGVDGDAGTEPPYDYRTSKWDNVNKEFPAIHYTISADEIPVVRFMTDATKNETRAAGTPIILFGTTGENIIQKQDELSTVLGSSCFYLNLFSE